MFLRISIVTGVFLLGLLAGASWPKDPVEGSQVAEMEVALANPAVAGEAALTETGASGVAPGESRDWGDKGEGVRFAAYNLKNYLSMRRTVNGETVEKAPKPEEEIAVVVRTIARVRPDILGLSEIGGMGDVDDMRRRLRDQGLSYPHVEWVDAADEDRHLALLSAFPLVERNSQTRLTYLLDDKEHAVQRGILDVTIQLTGDYRLRCVGVHLKSKREVDEGNQELMRRNEAQLLRRHVDGILGDAPETNLLVYGDFNETRNEPGIGIIQGRRGAADYLASMYLKDDHGESWTYHWSFANIYSRIDFIFFSPGMAPEIDWSRSFIYAPEDWETGSDHRLLVAGIIPVEKRRR